MIEDTTRRGFLGTAAATTIALGIAGAPAFAVPKDPGKPFQPAPLPYAYDALTPVIDGETMKLHRDKHHQAYADKLNGEIAKTPELAKMSLETILKNISQFNDTVRNNAGGVWNHDLFWRAMVPVGKTGTASPALAAAIDKSFGSMDKFKAAFEKEGMDRFGSGWVWLIRDGGRLKIVSTANQDNPVMTGTPAQDIIFGNDLWEHAYYLTYRNRRADYLKKWWSVVNWIEANRRYQPD